MSLWHFSAAVCGFALLTASAVAADMVRVNDALEYNTPMEWSTSSYETWEAPDPQDTKTFHVDPGFNKIVKDKKEKKPRQEFRPFSKIALGGFIGTSGGGVAIATPLWRNFDLRSSAGYFKYQNANFNDNGLDINGSLRLQTVSAQVDWMPFRNSFHVSPGVMFQNKNHVDAKLSVPAGKDFSLGDNTYTSSAIDPMHGNASFDFGSGPAPMLTFGWGNMIPRSGRHWSIPIDIGFVYIRKPVATLDLHGTACVGARFCGSFDAEPQAQADLKAEESELNDDIAPLRFFPVVTAGFAWRF